MTLRLGAFGLMAWVVAMGCASSEQPEESKSTDLEPDFEAAPMVARSRDAGAAQRSASASATPSAQGPLAVAMGGPALAATTIATTVYAEADRGARRLGYVRLGGIIRRAEQPVAGRGCAGFWYPVSPTGYICTDDATLDLDNPLVRATQKRPALDKPLPYAYGFVRATAPQYLRIPSEAEQIASEFKLLEHLTWYDENRVEVQRVSLGANDVPLDPLGRVRLGTPLPEGQRLSTELEPNELYGGGAVDGQVPFWLAQGRHVPNVSGFDVPEYAAFADRVRRKTGLSLVDSFVVHTGSFKRGFAVTVDLRLIPTTKLKPDTGSLFHGLALTDGAPLPMSMVLSRSATSYRLLRGRDEVRAGDALPHRARIPMSGDVRIKAGRRFYQTARDPHSWLAAEDLALFAPPPAWPPEADRGEKWIDVSLVQQTLVLYQGKVPEYGTLISSGRDRLGDPKTQQATPRGHFRIKSKHVAAAMDSEENSSVAGGMKAGREVALSEADRSTLARLEQLKARGAKLSEDDRRRLANIEKGRHPEYGVTERRGAATFELRDVPWIQYFDAGFAIHGAYWHDAFGVPRSHGCINLSPIDAHLVFNWTEPRLPEGWHGFNVGSEFGQGTAVVIRE